MVARVSSALESFESALAAGEVDDLSAFIRARTLTDTEVAEIIEADARARLDRGQEVDLGRYLASIPGLAQMPVTLDAAIEFALRGLSGSSRPTAAAVERLAARHPEFEGAIRNAAALSEGLATTNTLRRMDSPRSARALPSPFGPLTEDGWSRYELRRLLGHGSQGEVYLAVDRVMSEPDRPAMVAIKIAPGGLMSAADRWRAIDEATRARRIDHANVVRALDRGATEDGEVYIVYEHVDGGDLDALLRQGRLSERDAVKLLAQIARGVQAAHGAGLVHRDLKPSNVLLTSEGVPRVADFGCAAVIDDDGLADEGRVGNLAFIAPEQYRAEPGSQSALVDVYALGGILFFMLTGELPHGPTRESVRRSLGGAAAPASLDPRRHRPELDRDLAMIVQRATRARLEDRTPTADALATDLEAWLGHEPIMWTRPSLMRRARLLVKRSPRQVVLGLVAASVVLGAASASSYVWAAARGRVRVAEVERAAASAYATEKEQADQLLSERLRELQRGMIVRDLEPTDWMPVMTILESLTGPHLFSLEGFDRRLWEDRAAAAGDIIAKAEQAGHAGAIETLLWRDLRTFWLLRGGRAEEALAEWRRAEERWVGRLDADDPWLLLRASLAAAVDVAMAREARIRRGEVRTNDPKLADSAATLRRLEAHFAASQYGGSMHIFVLETLETAYGPRLLATPDDLAWARTKRRVLENEAYYERRMMQDEIEPTVYTSTEPLQPNRR